jgi:hypothetical protein
MGVSALVLVGILALVLALAWWLLYCLLRHRAGCC